MKKINEVYQNLKSQSKKRSLIQLGENTNIDKLKMYLSTICGTNYIWTEEVKKIYLNLFYYFHANDKTEYDLTKGIALIGSYGTGKTTIFNNFHKFLSTAYPFNKNMFRITSIEEIIDFVSNNNWIYNVNVYNTKQDFRGGEQNNPLHILINEFGHTYNAKSFGTDVNELIDMFLMKRYDIFQQDFKLTHITSNYDSNDLKEMFHPRIYDRFKEMFNIIELTGDSFRK